MDKKQRKKNPSTLLEHLPNEILCMVFPYLNGVDAIYAFSSLNYRFECLLTKYCQLYFDFKSISKTIFDFIFQHHDIQKWKSLRLADDGDTPQRIEYFFKNYSLVNHFPQLKSLSLLGIKPPEQNTLLTQLPSLTNLTSLMIDQNICGQKRSLFNLPNLTKLTVTSCINNDWIKGFSQLKNLEYTITSCCSYRESFMPPFTSKRLIWPSTLKRLKIVFKHNGRFNLVQRSLGQVPQLKTLEIYERQVGRSNPDGQVWEQRIRSSLPLLKTFKFYFQFYCRSYETMEKAVLSFSTPFYEHEKNWFVRCNLFHSSDNFAVLYSLPFPMERFTIYNGTFANSIPAHVNGNNIYVNVKTLVFDSNYMVPDDNFKKIKVTNLIINTYFNCFDWKHVWITLRHLEIKSNAKISPQDFSFILTNTPNLHSLIIKNNVLKILTEDSKNNSIYEELSRKISSLKFYSNGS